MLCSSSCRASFPKLNLLHVYSKVYYTIVVRIVKYFSKYELVNGTKIYTNVLLVQLAVYPTSQDQTRCPLLVQFPALFY